MSSRRLARHVATASLVTVALTGAAWTTASASPSPSPADPDSVAAAYQVSVGSLGSWTNPDDTPANAYIDKDGSFWFQSAHALYGASDPRKWNFFTGRDFDSWARSPISDAINPADSTDRNNDTTARCNNSPTGVESTFAPAGSGYAQKNYCDLAGVWIDPDTGDWYGLVHNEFTPQPFSDGLHYDAIDYAVSTDQGKTWDIKDHVITSPYSTKRGDTTAFPQQTYHYGDGDPRLFVDARSGYFYVYYGSRIVNKGGSWAAFYGHVARAPMSAKFDPSAWQKFYNGAWSEPGLGGKESNLVPISSNANGFTPPEKEYDPTNPGDVASQVAAGLTPPTSPLFVMDVTWNAHLGLYIGEPQGVDQSGNAPQEFYGTADLSKPQWQLLGRTDGYNTASWYRWLVDPVNKTSSSIVGKSFRAYCSFGCSGDRSGEYVNLTIDTDQPAAPVDPNATYRVSANGIDLTESVRFVPTGDGAYAVRDVASGYDLGVDDTSNAGRAWYAKPNWQAPGVTPRVGQQWFVLTNVQPGGSTPTGTIRLANRYSGQMFNIHNGFIDTSPARSWSDPSTGRSPVTQELTLTRVG